MPESMTLPQFKNGKSVQANPKVLEKPVRRWVTANYKLRIVQEAESAFRKAEPRSSEYDGWATLS